jgi:protein-S-isoprenylcysteine O-methyltransferase Ste14
MTRTLESRISRRVYWSLAKTLGQTVVIWTLALAVAPALIVRLETAVGLDALRMHSKWLRLAGAAVFTCAGSLGLWSGWTMAVIGHGTPLPLDPAPRLVIAGPYRWVRNPMAIGGLAQGAGVALWLGSPGVFLYVVCGFFVWNFGVRRWEERDLLRRFGPCYQLYQADADCWIPRRKPLPVRTAEQCDRPPPPGTLSPG